MCHSPNRREIGVCPVRPPPCGPGGPSHLVWKSSGRAAAAALRLPGNLPAQGAQGSRIRLPRNGEDLFIVSPLNLLVRKPTARRSASSLRAPPDTSGLVSHTRGRFALRPWSVLLPMAGNDQRQSVG